MFYELENLFIKNFDKIIHQKYKTKYNNINKGTFHKSNQLKKIKWETPILYYLKKYQIEKLAGLDSYFFLLFFKTLKNLKHTYQF